MINNTDTDKLFNQAAGYFQASDFIRAKKLISEILHISNNHFPAWLMYARLNIKNENIESRRKNHQLLLRMSKRTGTGIFVVPAHKPKLRLAQ